MPRKSETILRKFPTSFGYLYYAEEKNEYMFFSVYERECSIFIEELNKFTILSETHNKKYEYNISQNIPKIFFQERGPSIDILIIFKYGAKVLNKDTDEQLPCEYFLKKFNLKNNLHSFDSVTRNVLIRNSNMEILQKIKSAIYLDCNLSRISQNYFPIFSDEEHSKYLENISNFNEKSDFNSIYNIYAKISQNIKIDAQFDIVREFNKDYDKNQEFPSNKINKKTSLRNTNISENYFKVKTIQISPGSMIYQNNSLHHTSRFLRTYFKDDNFIKIEFLDETYSQLYTNKVKLSCLDKLYKIVFENGIKICGREYVFFIITTSGLRNNSMWLIDKNFLIEKDKNKIYREIGLLDLLDDTSMKFGKKIARVSQNFTSTIPFKLNHENLKISYEEDIYTPDKKYCYSDGCGKISKALMEDICNSLNNKTFASAVQIRFKGVKGVLLIDPNMADCDMMLTRSMVKFKCENCNDLEIVRFARYSQGFLNLQIIILLVLNGVKRQTILKYAKIEVDKIYHLNRKNFIKIISTIKKENLKVFTNKKNEAMSNISQYCFIYNKLSNLSKKFRIKVKNSCFLMGVVDFQGILNEGEIFIQISKNESDNKKKKVIKGSAIITKNPCISIYDLQKVNCVDIQEFHHFVNVVVFNSKGDIPLPQKISNSDLDGDIYFICWDKNLIKIKEKDYNSKSSVNYVNRNGALHNTTKIRETNDINTCDIQAAQVQEEKSNWNNMHTSNAAWGSNTHLNDQYISSHNAARNINTNGKSNYNIYTISFDDNSQDTNKIDVENKLLEFFIFYHKHNKLSDISKRIIKNSNNIFKSNGTTYFDLLELNEKLAHYHNIEVDFQKTGVTSEIIEAKDNSDYPEYLWKERYKKRLDYFFYIKTKFIQSNVSKELIKLEDIKEFLLKIEKEFAVNHYKNHVYRDKNLKLFEYKNKQKDRRELSLLFLIYDLISFEKFQHSSYYNAINISCRSYFHNNILNSKIKEYNTVDEFISEDSRIEINEIKNILKMFQYEIKKLMRDNDIMFEQELIYLLNIKNPSGSNKIEADNWKKTLTFETNKIISSCFEHLKEIKIFNKTNVEDILYILTYWLKNHSIKINGESSLIFNEFIDEENYKIYTVEEFYHKMLSLKLPEEMKKFYFENLKIISLYDLFCAH